MGQPNPPGDIPLIEGLGPEWNEIVSALPEDRRSELGPKIKERVNEYEPLKAWSDLHKSGVTPDFADTALRVFSSIENNPREVYETIGKYLGITPQEAKEAVKELEETVDEDDPRIATLQQQVDTLAQIALAQRQQTAEQQREAEQEAALDKELGDLKKKYGNDVNEREVIMRMLHDGMTAEQAYLDYSNLVSEIRKQRPSPMLLGGGGAIPKKALDVTKLSGQDTKTLVAQMMQQGLRESD